MSGFFNILKAGAKKAFGKGSNKNLTPELEALKGFKVSPTTGQKETRKFKIGVASKKLNKQISDLTTDRNKKSKELFKNK